MKSNDKKSNISFINKLYIFKGLSLLVGVLLVLITLLFFKANETNSIENLTEQTDALANIYANRIEEKFNDIEKVIEITSFAGFPLTDSAKKDWELQTSFYIDDYNGLESILLVDKEMIIQTIASSKDIANILGTSVNDYKTDDKHIDLLYAVFEDHTIRGLVYGNIYVVDLFSSILYEAENDYDIQVYSEKELIYASENIEVSNKNILKTSRISLSDVAVYEVTLTASKDLVASKIKNAYQILIYGLFLSLLVFVLIVVSQKYEKKSKMLIEVKDNLLIKQQQLEEQIKNQQKLEAIGTLASGVAHEINNPINGIMNYSQLILDSTEDDNDNALYAGEIISETKRVSALVQNILQFSSQKKPTGSVASVKDIVDKSLMLMNTIFKRDHVISSLSIVKDLPEVFCNSQQIQQVVMNLLSNAKDSLNEKYSGYDKNKKVTVFCDTITKQQKIYVRITVEDCGTGIEKEVKEKMFEQFYTTKETDKGTGLGLAISLSIIKDHNGEISVDTKIGEYTKFHVDLPCK